MRVKLLSVALNWTTNLLNICISLRQWGYAEKLVLFRKKHIAKNLRLLIK